MDPLASLSGLMSKNFGNANERTGVVEIGEFNFNHKDSLRKLPGKHIDAEGMVPNMNGISKRLRDMYCTPEENAEITELEGRVERMLEELGDKVDFVTMFKDSHGTPSFQTIRSSDMTYLEWNAEKGWCEIKLPSRFDSVSPEEDLIWCGVFLRFDRTQKVIFRKMISVSL